MTREHQPYKWIVCVNIFALERKEWSLKMRFEMEGNQRCDIIESIDSIEERMCNLNWIPK